MDVGPYLRRLKGAGQYILTESNLAAEGPTPDHGFRRREHINRRLGRRVRLYRLISAVAAGTVA